MKKYRGFTLIELLVVISILGLLVSILLPAMKNARKTAQKIVSLGNVNQINAASRMYADDMRGFLPVTMSYRRGTSNVPGESGTLEGWCTWSFGGKNNSNWWAGRAFDVEAADRPLNPYLYRDTFWDAPNRPQLMPGNYPARNIAQAAVFRDPSDKVTYQRNWPNEDPISSYDDVGTSYHWNARWWPDNAIPLGDIIPPAVRNAPFEQKFEWGTRQMRLADNFLSSRFAWVHDQTADVVVNQRRNYINGYGDFNRSVMGFLDGHASYTPLERGKATGPNYTLLFTFQQR